MKRELNIGDLHNLRIEQRGSCNWAVVADLSPQAKHDPTRRAAAQAEIAKIAKDVCEHSLGVHLDALDKWVTG